MATNKYKKLNLNNVKIVKKQKNPVQLEPKVWEKIKINKIKSFLLNTFACQMLITIDFKLLLLRDLISFYVLIFSFKFNLSLKVKLKVHKSSSKSSWTLKP